MAITWRTDYAIRIMFEAARAGGRSTIRELAESAGVPYDFSRSIARELAHSGLLVSRRGVTGGFELARPAEEITLRDIFEATGEPMSMALCSTDPTVCPRTDECPMHDGVWTELDRMIEEYLGKTTVADAVGRASELRALLAARC